MGISRRACETSHSGPHLPSLMRYALKFGVIHFAFLKSSLVMLTYVSSEGHTWRELGTKEWERCWTGRSTSILEKFSGGYPLQAKFDKRER